MLIKFQTKLNIIYYSISLLFFISCAVEKKDLNQDRYISFIAYQSYVDGKSKIFTMGPDGTGIKQLTKNNYNNSWPRWSPDGEKIIFVSDRDGNDEIYIMNRDGSEQRRITNHPADDVCPIWSPDGSMIAFCTRRYKNGGSEIVRRNIVVGETWGLNLTRLTYSQDHHSAKADDFLSWSPDGNWIAFESDRDRDDPEIYLINAVDGSNAQRLTYTRALDEVPSWSSDGSKILFSSDRSGAPHNGNYEIYIMSRYGKDLRRLTWLEGQDTYPSMSPDGKEIVFESWQNGYPEIYKMKSDGTNIQRLTFFKNMSDKIHNDNWGNSNPSWSPNITNTSSNKVLQKIVFESDRNGNHEIYTMNSDGSEQINISNHQGYDAAPVFSMGGEKITFVSDRDGQRDIWVMNADGSNQYNVTKSTDANGYPSWNPDGTKIAYDTYAKGASGGDIFVIDQDGGNPQNLTNTDIDEGYPSWSPQGNLITYDAGGYEESKTGNFTIYVIDLEQENDARPVTDNSGNSGDASWYPDGTKFVYSSDKDGAENGNYEIYSIKADGSGDVRLTFIDGADTDPAVSRDGRLIAFDSNRDGDSEIIIMNSNGTEQKQLTQNDAWDGMPNWGPLKGK